jgi:hypothetical protein
MGFLQGFRVVLFFDANRFDRRELSEDPFDFLNVMPYGNTDELKRSLSASKRSSDWLPMLPEAPSKMTFLISLDEEVPSVGDEDQNNAVKMQVNISLPTRSTMPPCPLRILP